MLLSCSDLYFFYKIVLEFKYACSLVAHEFTRNYFDKTANIYVIILLLNSCKTRRDAAVLFDEYITTITRQRFVSRDVYKTLSNTKIFRLFIRTDDAKFYCEKIIVPYVCARKTICVYNNIKIVGVTRDRER